MAKKKKQLTSRTRNSCFENYLCKQNKEARKTICWLLNSNFVLAVHVLTQNYCLVTEVCRPNKFYTHTKKNYDTTCTCISSAPVLLACIAIFLDNMTPFLDLFPY